MANEIEKVQVGDTARCQVTKLEGVVVVRHDYLYGMAQIGLKPQGSHEGKAHETIHMDLPQAELVEKGTVSRNGMIPSSTVKLGDKCEDSISGFKGICTGQAEWLYACTKVLITPDRVDEKEYKPSKGHWFDEPQIKVIKEEVVKKSNNNTGGFDKEISSSCSSYSTN